VCRYQVDLQLRLIVISLHSKSLDLNLTRNSKAFVQNDFHVRWFYSSFSDLFRALFKMDLKELGWGM
jgi:hypothetical protein